MAKRQIRLTEIGFKDILPFWRCLWPRRWSAIEPASAMLYPHGLDPSIKTRYRPRFFAVTFDGSIVGVNSGHQTGNSYYRSRGIWVDPHAKLRGIGRMLIGAVEHLAINAGCNLLWSVPRKSAMPFYSKCGFIQVTDFFDDRMEFGPNCYAAKIIIDL